MCVCGGGGGREVQRRGGCWSECDGSLGIEVVLSELANLGRRHLFGTVLKFELF